ncbi:MAG: methylenetetrahydrofolate--tRNA-(uracil(54)-C(5))-methyltransferase (FADH(2)-oxidizing) TrmFO [Actinomycetia bacterium]|nr:methylenetetrahydrofolate--tRNA-(uracil(54)-C(5))-methyltransferase (FADH(2)-oxidizing) TrmFO [Actinomycetes bacterium]
MNKEVKVIGAGLAGSEAAWQLAERGVRVKLFEMRPEKLTPAHKTGNFGELVCSNSFKSIEKRKATGILKKEMKLLNSLIIDAAEKTKVPAGIALAVDRLLFSELITEKLNSHPKIEIIRKEIKKIPKNEIVLIATGPLTSDSMEKEISGLLGQEYLYFYDAASPIIYKESLDMTKLFLASRYEKGEASYLNASFDEKLYNDFVKELVNAKTASLHSFEKTIFFEGCMPVEEMAKRGDETLRFGPLKPVGLRDPKTGKIPYAVVQFRQDNKAKSLFNIVGFQTNLKTGEQKRVFKMIPGMENAEFARFGMMHRNTYMNSPKHLSFTLNLEKYEDIYFAGQITGVEGYLECAVSGIISAVNICAKTYDKNPVILPETTVTGALLNYITSAQQKNFQPMNVNFGLLPPLENRLNKKERYIKYGDRALRDLKEFISEREDIFKDLK